MIGVYFFGIYANLMFFYYVQSFEQFLYDNHNGNLLDEQNKSGGLMDKSRKKLVNVAVEFTVSIFGDKPNKTQKVMVANVVAAIFPTVTAVRNVFKQIVY